MSKHVSTIGLICTSTSKALLVDHTYGISVEEDGNQEHEEAKCA